MDMNEFIKNKRKEIKNINPEKGDEIFLDGLKISKSLAINSYKEQIRRGEKIQNSVNAVLTSVSFLFAGFMLYISFAFCILAKSIFGEIILFLAAGVILSAIIIMILASMYKKYELFKEPEEQLKGTFEKLVHTYGVLENKFVPGLEETILLIDLNKVHKSIESNNTTKRRLLKSAIILLIIFIGLFAVSLVTFGVMYNGK